MHRNIVLKTRPMQVAELQQGEDLGALLERLYVAEGLTQEAIAGRLGTSRQTVASWLGKFDIRRPIPGTDARAA